MRRAVAVIYARGQSQENISAQVATLKSRIRNDGSVFRGKNLAFTDIKPSTEGLTALLTAIERDLKGVIYISYTSLRPEEKTAVKSAIRRAYIYGLSAIVCDLP